LQSEENVARKKLLVVLWCTVHTGNATAEKPIPSNCTERCSLRPVTSLGHPKGRRVFREGPKFF